MKKMSSVVPYRLADQSMMASVSVLPGATKEAAASRGSGHSALSTIGERNEQGRRLGLLPQISVCPRLLEPERMTGETRGYGAQRAQRKVPRLPASSVVFESHPWGSVPFDEHPLAWLPASVGYRSGQIRKARRDAHRRPKPPRPILARAYDFLALVPNSPAAKSLRST